MPTDSETLGREQDWGVPLPGTLLPARQWTQTHLKRLPLGKLVADQLFGRHAPLVIDLGCGNGRFTILSALRRPDHDHVAVDVFPGAIRHAARRANRRGLANVRFAVADAADLVQRLLPDQSADEVHIYHPQPVYDLAQATKRLLTPAFLVQLYRVLKPTGLLVLQTDHPAYWEYLRQVVPTFFVFEEELGPWPDAPQGRTRREILARQRNLPIFRAICRPIPTLDPMAARNQADALPLPRFDADRALQHLDEVENRQHNTP